MRALPPGRRAAAVLVAAAALTLSRPARAMPPCPSSVWVPGWWAPAERWPDPAHTNDSRLLRDMTRELYDGCPREEDTDALLTAAGEKYLRLAGSSPERAHEREEIRFILGMVYTHHAPPPDRDDRVADLALSHFIALTRPDLRGRARDAVGALRLRKARKAASIARYTLLNANNIGRAGWRGASQRVRCFIAAYPGYAADEEVRLSLSWLQGRARDFIHDYAQEPRYDLAGMRVLLAELTAYLADPSAPRDRWPSMEELDPADPENPANCYRLPSRIPGPDGFDFDPAPEGPRELEKARRRVQSMLETTLP